MTLDGKAQIIATLSERMAVPPSLDNLAKARAQFEAFKVFFDNHRPALHRVEDLTISGAGSDIPCRLYVPRTSEAELMPVLVFFHGGGFCYGGLDDATGPCPRLAAAGGFAVLSVDYSLAPEHVFPAAVDDAVAAFQWSVTHGDTVGLDPTRVAVGGDSAGGCLATAVCRLMRNKGGPHPTFQLLIYPVTDTRPATPSRKEFETGYFLTKQSIDFFLNTYIPDPEQRLDPRAAPLLSKDLRTMADALVITAGFDPLRDEAKAYAEALRLAGSQVEYVCYEDMIHGFASMAGVLPQGARALEHAAQRLRDAFARP